MTRVFLVHVFVIGLRSLRCINRIGGVMVSVLVSSAVDHGFEPWSGQTKNY